MTKQLLVFSGSENQDRIDVSGLEEFPNKQSQALALLLQDVQAWIAQTRELLGNSLPASLQAVASWVAESEKLMGLVNDDLWNYSEEDGDGGDDIDDDGNYVGCEWNFSEPRKLANCQLGAGDDCYDAINDLLDCYPEDSLEDGGDFRSKKMASVTERLLIFWLENIRRRIAFMLEIMSSAGGDPISIVKAYKETGVVFRWEPQSLTRPELAALFFYANKQLTN